MNAKPPRIRNLSLDLDTWRTLDRLAATEERSKIAVVRRALGLYAAMNAALPA